MNDRLQPWSGTRDGVSTAATKRVLHVVNGEFYAGAERVQELLAQRLPAFGYTAAFACLKQGPFVERLRAQHLDAQAFVMRSRFDVGPARRIAQYAQDTGCELIHSHTSRSALVGSLAAAFSGLPLVHHVHSPTSHNTEAPVSDRINALVERLALRRAAALVPVSHDLARHLRDEGFPGHKLVVVHNGVTPGTAVPDREAHADLRAGVVALFRPRKGMEILLRALARLVEAGRPVRLRAVGEFESTEYEEQIRDLAENLGVSALVDWRGFCVDVRQELERMDVLVLPSLFGEGLPMVVLEAMAVGLPIVATRVGGISELVRNGQDGLLVEPEDVDALVRALSLLAEQPAALAAMGAEGLQHQRNAFSDTAMARQVSQIYDRVIDGAGTRLRRREEATETPC